MVFCVLHEAKVIVELARAFVAVLELGAVAPSMLLTTLEALGKPVPEPLTRPRSRVRSVRVSVPSSVLPSKPFSAVPEGQRVGRRLRTAVLAPVVEGVAAAMRS